MLTKMTKSYTKAKSPEQLVTISPESNLDEALKKMREAKVHHLLVMSEGRLLGILSSRELVQEVDACHWPGTSHPVSVGEVMRVGIPVLTETSDLKTAISLMLEKGLDSIPYEVDGKIAGILTETDLLHLLDKSLRSHHRKEAILETSEAVAADPLVQRVIQLLSSAGI